MIILPTSQDLPHYSFRIDLEQITYQLEFHWNTREAAWYMSILDAGGTLLLAGRKVVLGFPLLARFKDARFPPGDMIAIDTTNTDTEPGEKDLGVRVKLIYVDAAELHA